MFETGIPQGQEGETNSLETGKDDTPWWLKYAGRGCGIVGGLLAMLLGLFNIITFSASCLVAGILQMITGAIVASIEGPCLCHFSQRAQQVSDMIEGRPKWNRAALYIVLALIPMVFFCFNISIFFGSGCIFVTGAIYGAMSVGKKASRSEMLQNAEFESQRGYPISDIPATFGFGGKKAAAGGET